MIDFEINQDFIAKVLCIKKDEPMTVCNGQCFLTNQLKKQDENEQQQTNLTLKQKIEVFCQENSIFENPELIIWDTSTELSSYKNIFVPSGYLEEIFHPPQFS